MAEAKQEFDKTDSIEVKMNAKQEYSWAIKLYFNNEEHGSDKVLNDIGEIHTTLMERFV